jgi:putative sigma-54 modulation protein
MQVEIHGRNLKIGEKVEEFATRKLERLDRYLPNIKDVRLELARQNTRRGEDLLVAQITVRHARGAILRAEERGPGDDLHMVVSNAIDNMYRRIQRFKGKRTRKGAERFSQRYAATSEELAAAEEIPASEMPPPDSAVDTTPEVVRRKDINVIPMTEREAIEQMELLGHPFFIFFNQDTEGINVVYRRADGDYGVLLPKLSL